MRFDTPFYLTRARRANDQQRLASRNTLESTPAMNFGFGAGSGLRPSRAFRLVSALASFSSLLLLGCESTEPDDGGPAGNILISDENNYESESALSIPTVETASATDLDICWTDVVTDIQCHDLDPEADLDNVALLRFLNLTEDQVEVKLTTEQLTQSEIDGYLEYNTGSGTCAKLSAMSFFGTPIEVEEQYVESQDQTYLLVLTEGITPGVGARTMMFIKPTSTSTNTTVDVQAGCGFLEFSADLVSAETLSIPREGPWVVDWRNVTRDGQGNPVSFSSIDGVLLGFYENLTVTELQSQIFDLELLATSLWEIDLKGGRTADLGQAKNRDDGSAFAGFTRTDGVWALALMCSACSNPAPIVLTIVEPGAD
jgi:hypothetical protein